MAIRNILIYPDEALSKKSHTVVKFDQRLKRLIEDMKDTLADANGVGLAAPQVGVLRRVVIVDAGDGAVTLVNPEIIASSGEQDGCEGCLSVPGRWGMVKRPNVVTVRAQDEDGNYFEMTGEGLKARAFCHELDHLEGRVFLPLVSEFVDPEETDAVQEEEGR